LPGQKVRGARCLDQLFVRFAGDGRITDVAAMAWLQRSSGFLPFCPSGTGAKAMGSRVMRGRCPELHESVISAAASGSGRHY